VRSLILAGVNPDNTPHGYNWTFAFPMLLVIIIGVILYLLFSRPHRRVPRRALTLPARSAAVPSPEVAASTAVAGGLDVAPGGGALESHLEPHGAHLVATAVTEEADVSDAPVAADTTGAAPGDAAAGHTGPGDTAPGDAVPGDTAPGDAGQGEGSAEDTE
jgi:hypothetical protein